MHKAPRKRRQTRNIPGQAHMLTFSCYHGLPLLSKDRSRAWFIESLERSRETWRFKLWAYVVMPDHAHILLLPHDEKHHVEGILKSIKQSVARKAVAYLRENNPAWLDRLRVTWPSGRTEFRFWQQGGGYDRNVFTSDAAIRMARYIHRNPVKAGLIDRPEAWRWSSASWYSRDRAGPITIDDGLLR